MTKSLLAFALASSLALCACASRATGPSAAAAPSAATPAAPAPSARPYVTSHASPVSAAAPVTLVQGAIPFDAHDLAPEAAAASAGGRPVAMYFLATWCGYCRKMETQTLKTAAVQAEMAHWYDVQVNPDTPAGRALAAKYTTGAYPTVVVFDTRGNVRGTIVGCQDPAMFESRLRAAR